MSRRLYTSPLAVGLLALAFAAHAEVFKCKDATGRIIYGEKNEPKMQCTLVTAEITVVPAVPVTRPATPPSPNPADTQRQELQNKIKEQEQALADAKKNLAEQESIRLRTEVFYQSVLDRLKPYQDKVAELEKALDQSRAELNNLK